MIDRQVIPVLLLGQGDCDGSTVVHVPSIRTVIAGDFVYNGTHVWTADTTPERRTEWIRNLGRIAELGVERVIAGHRAPEQGTTRPGCSPSPGSTCRTSTGCWPGTRTMRRRWSRP